MTTPSMTKHFHKALYVAGKLVDECAACGESWRNTDVHFRSFEESAEYRKNQEPKS